MDQTTTATPQTPDLSHPAQGWLQDLQFANWIPELDTSGSSMTLRWRFHAPCSKDGVEKEWTTRKWPISRHMTQSEFVGTAFKAVLTALEHEAREMFLYRGRPVYNPHTDIEALLKACVTEEVRA